MRIVYKKPAELTPYENNPRHNDDAVEGVAASIKEFGFKVPIVIDRDGVIVCGHTRHKAAQVLGLDKVPCIVADDLTDEQVRAFRLADNKTAEAATWDMSLVELELGELMEADYDISVTGFSVDTSFFDEGRPEGETNEDYEAFKEKFEQKLTTDDCYTPTWIYDAVQEWTTKRYNISKNKIIRPFFPGGDYQSETYPAGAVVVDNPPFSILAEIIRFYAERNIKYFLFCPGLTALTGAAYDTRATIIAADAVIEYDNGAQVRTSFVTNMEPGNVCIMTAPDLYTKIRAEVEAHKQSKTLPKYEYPPEVVTSALMNKYSNKGVDFAITYDECRRIDALDAQKDEGKSIFGDGLLIGRNAAKKRAAADAIVKETDEAIVWPLSERERAIVDSLGGADNEE